MKVEVAGGQRLRGHHGGLLTLQGRLGLGRRDGGEVVEGDGV